MLKRLRTAHPILYCVLSEVLFLGSMVVFSLLATIVLAAAGADFDTMDGYLFGSVQEAVGLAVALLLLARTGRLDLLRRRGCGFLNGLLVGMYPLFFIGYNGLWDAGLWAARSMAAAAAAPHPAPFWLNMILGGRGRGAGVPGHHCPDPAGALRHRPRRGVESLPCVRRAVWRGAPEQPARFGAFWRADAVRVCGFAGRDAGRQSTSVPAICG